MSKVVGRCDVVPIMKGELIVIILVLIQFLIRIESIDTLTRTEGPLKKGLG